MKIHRVVGFYRAAINANQLSLLWITGEAGVGKSRLMEAVSQDLGEGKSNGSVSYDSIQIQARRLYGVLLKQ